ncbi:MAG TPA: hypothetical protein VI260_28590 [Blastocatellia bacterium]|jgi:hypothetical protein
MMKARGSKRTIRAKTRNFCLFVLFASFASISFIIRRIIGKMSPDISGLGAIDMPGRHCGMRHAPYERSLKIDVTTAWSDLFNRSASPEGGAIKQIAPHHQPSEIALFIQRS